MIKIHLQTRGKRDWITGYFAFCICFFLFCFFSTNISKPQYMASVR